MAITLARDSSPACQSECKHTLPRGNLTLMGKKDRALAATFVLTEEAPRMGEQFVCSLNVHTSALHKVALF